MSKVELDYYEVGNINDIVVSQSLLSKIDPKRSGSPKKLKAYLEEENRVQTLPMLRGSIFHLYCEDKNAFAISEAVKPSEKLGIVADAVAEAYDKLEDDQSKDEFILMLDKNILYACRAIGWNNNWKDEAIIKNSASVGVYLKALNDPDNKGKIILTQVLKDQIEQCIVSLTANEYAHRLLFWKDEFSQIDYYKEKAIFWEEKVIIETGEGQTKIENQVKCKAKLDDLIINHETKTIKINDPKTTGGSAHNFEGTFKQYRLDIQFAMYKRAVTAFCNQCNLDITNYKWEFRNIVVETNGIFETVVHRWSPNIIQEAEHDLDLLMKRLVRAKMNGFSMSWEEELGQGEVRHKELTS